MRKAASAELAYTPTRGQRWVPKQKGSEDTSPGKADGSRKRRSGGSQGDDEDDEDSTDDRPYKMSRQEEIDTTDPVKLWWIRIVVRTTDLDMAIADMSQHQFVHDFPYLATIEDDGAASSWQGYVRPDDTFEQLKWFARSSLQFY